MDTVEEVRAYLALALESFVSDPAETDFQLGYQAALQEVQREIDRAGPRATLGAR